MRRADRRNSHHTSAIARSVVMGGVRVCYKHLGEMQQFDIAKVAGKDTKRCT